MENIINRRKFDRLHTSDLQVLFSTNWKEIATHVDVINVSLGGLCFLTKSAIRVGEKIILTFPFRRRFIILNSTVVWAEGREIGAEFSETHGNIIAFMEIFNREYPELENKFHKKKNNNKCTLVAPLNFARQEPIKLSEQDFDCQELDVIDESG